MRRTVTFDWKAVHRWWSTWGLGLQAALAGLYSAWDAFQSILPLWGFVGGSMGLSILVWWLSHISQPERECCDDEAK